MSPIVLAWKAKKPLAKVKLDCFSPQVMICLGHRHQSEHSCANLQEVARPMQATSEVVKVTF